MKYLILVLMLVGSMNTSAEISTSGLTEEQKAQLQLQAAQMKAQAPSTPVNPEDVERWISVGKSVGVGFAATAVELGTTVDKLLDTTIGIVALILIIGYVAGGTAFGLLWLTVGLTLWFKYFKKICLVPIYQYDENGKVKSMTYSNDFSDISDRIIVFMILLAIIIVAGTIMVFA